jgi:hypothetical protein
MTADRTGCVPGSTERVFVLQSAGRAVRPGAGAPVFTHEVRHTLQTLADGTHVEHTDTTQLYRDAQGRIWAESPNRVFICDPVAGFTADLLPSEKRRH